MQTVTDFYIPCILCTIVHVSKWLLILPFSHQCTQLYSQPCWHIGLVWLSHSWMGLKGYLSGSRLNSQWWYLVLFMSSWGLWFMIGHVQLSLLIMGGGSHWGIDNHRLFIFLILLKFGWKVSACVRMISVKSFPSQTTHSIAMIKNPNALYMSIIGWDIKTLATSDTESDHARVLSLHLYRWEQCMYSRSPERDQYIRAY